MTLALLWISGLGTCAVLAVMVQLEGEAVR